MPEPSPDIGQFLAAHDVSCQRFEHQAVFTCEEAEHTVPAETGALHTKNLFLRDKKGRRHWLLVTTCAKAVDLKGVAGLIGADNLSLGSPDRLRTYLGVTPGSVTILGLVNDPGHQVELLIDADVWAAGAITAHPLVNTATLVLPHDGVERFLAATGHVPTLIGVPVRT
jgi:Ala-tRNA(Pro) deacylase